MGTHGRESRLRKRTLQRSNFALLDQGDDHELSGKRNRGNPKNAEDDDFEEE